MHSRNIQAEVLTKETTKDVRRKIGVVFENPENTPFMENGKSFKTYSTSNQEIPTPNYIESRKIQGN